MAPNSSNTSANLLSLQELRKQLLLLGLTGGIGSGKTAVSDLLGQFGAGIVDTDLIAHQITAPGGNAIDPIRAAFGAEYIDPDGAMDRAKMRHLVFSHPEARKTLESITHPLIRQETLEQANVLAQKGVPYLVFVVPLLIESGTWLDQIDYLIVVDCPEETQISRVMRRSNLTRVEAEAILKAQASRQERLTHANAVIENNSSLDALKTEVQALHQKILQIRKS